MFSRTTEESNLQTTSQITSTSVSRPTQSERSYASVTRTESRQSTLCQNNQAIQEQIISPSPEPLVISIIQELQHLVKKFMEKMGVMLNTLTMLVIKMT
jgi:hypothetical protein